MMYCASRSMARVCSRDSKLPSGAQPSPNCGAPNEDPSMFNSDGSKPNDGNEAVLVVDDDDAAREVMCAGLRKLGYRVLSAKNCEDALTVAGRHSAAVPLVYS